MNPNEPDPQEIDDVETERLPEGTRHRFLDLLLEYWPRIAALANDGFHQHGRGVVTLQHGSIPPALAYRPGAPCACHRALVGDYDPARQVVVAVMREQATQSSDDAETAHVTWIAALGGWPPPAAAVAPAAALGRSTH